MREERAEVCDCGDRADDCESAEGCGGPKSSSIDDTVHDNTAGIEIVRQIISAPRRAITTRSDQNDSSVCLAV